MSLLVLFLALSGTPRPDAITFSCGLAGVRPCAGKLSKRGSAYAIDRVEVFANAAPPETVVSLSSDTLTITGKGANDKLSGAVSGLAVTPSEGRVELSFSVEWKSLPRHLQARLGKASVVALLSDEHPGQLQSVDIRVPVR